MEDLIIKSNELNLNAAEKKLFALAFGEIITTYYKDKANLKKFEENKEILQKEVKRLEAERNSGKKEQKS